jgi:acyl-coenzyme A thioesterase PaaI-like protein
MQTTASFLRAALETRDGALRLTLDPRFQGLPDTAHGGSVLGALDLVADLAGAREITGVYRRRVPLGVPLALTVTRHDGLAYALRDENAVLVEGHVSRAATPPPSPPSRARGGAPLPVSRMCFACGTDNTIGLRARLAHDDATVHGRWIPDARFRDGDGHIPAVAITTLLDEAAFWLGALATGESGMTTDLRVTVHRPAPVTSALTVVGRRADVVSRLRDDRYWITRVAAIDDDGTMIASAAITFAAVRGAARRLVGGLLATNSAAQLRAVFPRYIETA